MADLRYDEDYAVELFDQVEVKVNGWTCCGEVKKLHPRLNQVTIRYDTGGTHRTSLQPIWKTGRFAVDQVVLLARDC